MYGGGECEGFYKRVTMYVVVMPWGSVVGDGRFIEFREEFGMLGMSHRRVSSLFFVGACQRWSGSFRPSTTGACSTKSNPLSNMASRHTERDVEGPGSVG